LAEVERGCEVTRWSKTDDGVFAGNLLGVVAVKRFQQCRDRYFRGERADVSEIGRHSRHRLMDAPGAVIQLLIRLSVHRSLICKLLP
jgi:hypothetical protein